MTYILKIRIGLLCQIIEVITFSSSPYLKKKRKKKRKYNKNPDRHTLVATKEEKGKSMP